ncbi:rho GTPase-activating protein 190 isoform X12 [Hyalella azteca]|uniref:Rho GTPase-activating protein 190 isoform X12 n=1 Tax=Hyalella azteca TaxID=294128 RepID=A0A979FTB4_HYAAZ|nr:rho GTPase-activating protein 190 isoform X12 [Hyalella azteca]
MARRGECGRQVVVSVVGVSGGEREKGVTGVGKSCLCNRFIRPQADNYHVDHISVLSQTDFSGRVVNNDHFLYWGETTRVSEDAVEYNFQVIEQTEFIDDASFMPFKAGKMDPYIKRCCQTKITSAEKLMYICKNQLGIEREYEQKVLPDGKLNVDGFLCIFDVSPVPNRSLEKMVELTASILNNCVKTKRPVVLVTTKNDEANEIYVKEAEKLASRKEFKGNIPLVETSSHETVNVETAFMTVAQLVERNRGRVRILPYYEAARHRKEMIDVATDGYLRLVRSSVTDYRALWSSSSKKLSQSPDFVIFVDLMGLDCAAKLFRRHTRKLKDEFLQRKVESYMDLLPSILREFFPNLRSLQDGEWLTIQQRISEHPDFERYFLRCHEDLPWTENLELLDSADSRIPFDVLDSNEAETVYKNHVNALQAELEMRDRLPKRMRDRFKQLLEETGYVTAGKRLDEVRVLFMGRESFDSLTEHDRQIIYDQHQKEITEKARANYMELLLEHAELFNHFKSVAPNGSVTQEDVRDITQALNTDSRHKALDRLDGERTLLLLQHLGFIHCPKPEHCPAYPNCTDTLVNKILAARHAARPNSWSGKSVGSGCSPVDRHINLVLLGKDGLAQTLHAAIRAEFAGDEVEVEGEVYCLDYRTIEGDVTQPQNAFATPDFSPHGVVCVYSTSAGLDYLRASLEHQLLGQLERDEAAPTTAILYAPHPSLDQLTQHALHQEGTSLAQSLQCSFVDAGSASETGDGNAREDGEGDVTGEGSQELDRSIVNRSIRKLVTSIHHRTTSLSLFQSVTLQAQACPDIRVIMCVLCGDPYSLEAVLNPLLSSPLCVPAGDRTLQIHSFLDESKRVVEVCVSSYHGALAFREELVHGFILVYSAKRRASLAALKAFSANIPNLPIQVLAVTESGSASAFFGSEVTQQLMTEGNAVADRLQAHYTTTNASPHQTSTTFTPFFKEVWDKKPEIEQAFNMEDPSGLEDSGEGTLERPGPAVRLVGRGGSAFTPVRRSRAALPPRSHSAEGSEIYESVPPGCEAFGGSLGDDLDEPLSPSLGGVYGGDDVYPGGRHPAHAHYGFSGSAAGRAVAGVGGSVGSSSTQHLTPSDDSDIYSHIDNEDDEQQLVKPSQLKKQRRFQQDLSGSRESLTTRDSGTAPDNFPRWVDDSALGGGRKTTEEYWVGPGAAGDRGPSTGGAYQPHSSTTGRRGRLPPPPTRVKPKSSHTLKTFLSLSDAVSQVTNKQPGKLNLKAYSNVTDALSKLAVGDGVTPTRLLTKAAIDSADSNAPLATPESAEDLGGDYSQVKDAVPGLYPDAGAAGEFAYARVPELSQAASAKARQRQRREKQQGASTSACSDSDSDWSSLERRRNADSSRKGVPKRVKKKRIPIPVATPRVPGPPRVPPLPGSMFTADVGMFGAAGALGDDSKPLLLDQPEKGSRSGESSEESDGEQSQLPNEPLLPPPNTAGLQKKGFQFKSKTGREGVAVRPPVVPFAPSVRSNSSSSPHNPSSLMGRGMAVSSPRPPFQLTPDSDVSSPLCRGEGPDGGSYFPDDSSMDMPSPRDMQSPNPGGGQPALPNQTSVLQDKNARKKQEKLRNKEEARIREDEKKRVKEEEKAKKKERENKKKSAKSGGKGGAPKPVANWEEFIQSPDHPVPLFVDKCVQFIELEGLDSEGIYRVPGNKIHVEHLSTKYKEDSSVDFATLDVPVNAAATALKDYLKQLPPLLPPGKMEQLTAIAASPLPGQGDRSCRLLKLKELLTELPSLNFLIIKFIFQHFVRVAEHSKLNSMDSKNLAICWWPTLFHTLQFTDIVEFESLRPHIEDIVQTMIDQFPFLFQGKEDYVMV